MYREASFYLKYIRSLELSNFERIVTDLQSVYEELYPIYGDKVELYSDDSYSLDKLLGISTKLEKAYEKKAWLTRLTVKLPLRLRARFVSEIYRGLY